MGTGSKNIKTSKSEGHSGVLSWAFNNYLGCAITILCILVFPVAHTLTWKITNLPNLSVVIDSQGRREGGTEGAVCPRASRSRGPHHLLSKIFLYGLFSVFKEPPNRSSLQGPKTAFKFRATRFPCFLSLLPASITVIWQFCPWASKASRRPWY